MEQVVLVDTHDKELGFEEKLEAHRQGKLHRAFSIYVFNRQGQLMLQKRHSAKYHSGGLWTNTCCSHPRPGETVLEAAHRRLKEEMGFNCELREEFSFVYNVKLDRELTEHEYLHIFIGGFDGEPIPNPEEAEGWKWVSMSELETDVAQNPENYTEWLKISLKQLSDYLKRPRADFFSNEYRNRVESELKKFLPEKATQEWAAIATASGKNERDTEALTKAISEPAWNILSGGGKRMRPLLMLICCEAVGGKVEDALPFTPVPEIIHNGTLVADDIEDNSNLRRGKPSIHVAYGVDIAINLSSTMMLLPIQIIRDSSLPPETKNKAYDIISTLLLKCHIGQAADIYWHTGKSSTIPSEAEYFQMCSDKTGALASMAAQLGALLGGGSEEQIRILGSFAEKAGVAFQIQDDILDFEVSGATGKKYADDISEGKRTLLVIHTLNKAPAEERNRLLQILNMRTKDEKLLREAIAIIKKHDSIKYAQQAMHNLIEDAWKQVDAVLQESEAKVKLNQFSQMLINRTV